MPANGETVTLPTSPGIPVGISLGLLKREMVQGMKGTLGPGLGEAVNGWLVSAALCLSLQDCFLRPKSLGSCMAP